MFNFWQAYTQSVILLFLYFFYLPTACTIVSLVWLSNAFPLRKFRKSKYILLVYRCPQEGTAGCRFNRSPRMPLTNTFYKKYNYTYSRHTLSVSLAFFPSICQFVQSPGNWHWKMTVHLDFWYKLTMVSCLWTTMVNQLQFPVSRESHFRLIACRWRSFFKYLAFTIFSLSLFLFLKQVFSVQR